MNASWRARARNSSTLVGSRPLPARRHQVRGRAVDDIKKPPPAGYEIPYPGLNDKLGGVRLGELVLFTAGSGIGKSTIVNEIAYHLMMAHGLTLGVMALEENPARNARRYLGIPPQQAPAPPRRSCKRARSPT